jgi:hypothetical protein
MCNDSTVTKCRGPTYSQTTCSVPQVHNSHFVVETNARVLRTMRGLAGIVRKSTHHGGHDDKPNLAVSFRPHAHVTLRRTAQTRGCGVVCVTRHVTTPPHNECVCCHSFSPRSPMHSSFTLAGRPQCDVEVATRGKRAQPYRPSQAPQPKTPSRCTAAPPAVRSSARRRVGTSIENFATTAHKFAAFIALGGGNGWRRSRAARHHPCFSRVPT